MNIAFGPYRPDEGDITPGVSSNIINAFPIRSGQGIGYGPIPDIQVLNAAEVLAAAPRGGLTAVTDSGAYKAYIATASNIYEMDAIGAFTELGSGYSLPAGRRWSAMQFGDFALWTNAIDGMLQYNVESGGAVTSVSGAPAARFMFEAFDTVFMGDCDGNNALLRNSDFNDHTEWTKGVAKKKTFATGNELIAGAAVSKHVAVVLQRNAIRRLTRVANRTLYNVDTLAEGIGGIATQSTVTINGMMFFLDHDGFYMTNGQEVVPIGSEKINRTFAASLGSGERQTVQAAADPTRQMIFWRYQTGTGNSDDVFSNMLAYSWKLNEFVEVERDTSMILTMASPGYNLDNIDSFGDADTAGLPLADDPFWNGGDPVLGALDENYKFGFFNGSNLAATLETNNISSARSQLYRSVLPNTDCTNATVQIGVADQQGADKTYSTAVGIQSSGRSPVRARGKVSSLKLNIPAGETWSYANGFSDIEVSSGGKR